MVKSGICFGTFQHNLDAKNRLMLPKRLNCEPETVLFLVHGYEGCLELHTEESFMEKIDQAKKLPSNLRESRLHTRMTVGNSLDVRVDAQGRIVIPSLFVTKYELGKEVYLIGAIDHYEIWDKTKWEQYESDHKDDFEDNAQGLSEE